ncbi:MAG: hypothetical protein ABR587_17575 [Candidatus Binatia bacterium]
MNPRSRTTSILSALLVTLVLAAAASADKGGQGKGGGKSGKGASQGSGNAGKGGKGNSGAPGKSANAAAKGKGGGKFETSQRSAIQNYYRDDYERSGNCPPGLAKKNNGCQPPGQARRWDVGQPLPPDVVLMPLPSALRTTLSLPVPGYDYGYVEGSVVLFSTSSRVVVDIVVPF